MKLAALYSYVRSRVLRQTKNSVMFIALGRTAKLLTLEFVNLCL